MVDALFVKVELALFKYAEEGVVLYECDILDERQLSFQSCGNITLWQCLSAAFDEASY